MGIPETSIIIPTHNNASTLVEVLLALQPRVLAEPKLEIIVVNDGSTDETETLLESLNLPPSYHILHQANGGAAVARNQGAAISKGRILIFLDSDVVPDRDLVHSHMEFHRQHSNALVVGQTRSVSAGDCPIFHQVMGQELYAFCLGEEATELHFRDFVSRNLSMPKAIFTGLGGFDNEYPNSGFEDTDLAIRALQAGYRLWYNPLASGEHRHTGTLEQVGRHMYNYQVSAALLFRKHPEVRGQFRHLEDKEPIALGQDSIALTTRKLMRWTLAKPPVDWVVRQTVKVLERLHPSHAILRMAYWQVLGTYLYRGYREGRRRYGLDH